MDLNFCLYCEKHLPQENMSFCSPACQAKEASKPVQQQQLQIIEKSRTPPPSLLCFDPTYHRPTKAIAMISSYEAVGSNASSSRCLYSYCEPHNNTCCSSSALRHHSNCRPLTSFPFDPNFYIDTSLSTLSSASSSSSSSASSASNDVSCDLTIVNTTAHANHRCTQHEHISFFPAI